MGSLDYLGALSEHLYQKQDTRGPGELAQVVQETQRQLHNPSLSFSGWLIKHKQLGIHRALIAFPHSFANPFLPGVSQITRLLINFTSRKTGQTCDMSQRAGVTRAPRPACTLCCALQLPTFQTAKNQIASKSNHLPASNLPLEKSSKAPLQES